MTVEANWCHTNPFAVIFLIYTLYLFIEKVMTPYRAVPAIFE
jgi:hypothetical protein